MKTENLFIYANYDASTDVIEIKNPKRQTVATISFDENGDFVIDSNNKENIELLNTLLKLSKMLIDIDVRTEYESPYDIAENLDLLFLKQQVSELDALYIDNIVARGRTIYLYNNFKKTPVGRIADLNGVPVKDIEDAEIKREYELYEAFGCIDYTKSRQETVEALKDVMQRAGSLQ